MTFKKLFIAAGILAAGTFSATASDIIYDNLVGGGYSYIGKGSSIDSIGGSAYDIYSMEVSRTNAGLMTVRINTKFVDNVGRYKFGDLLMSVKSGSDSSAWQPRGSAPHLNDDYQNTRTTWEYAYDINGGRYESGDFTDGSGRLVSIDNPRNRRSYNYGSDRKDYGSADDHIWKTKDRYTTDLNNGLTHMLTSNTTGDYLEFVFNVSGTALASADQVAFHWTMSCANDIIEGVVDFARNNVPEPAALGLMLLGLTGVGFARRRKKSL